jgi:hypothetical protein
MNEPVNKPDGIADITAPLLPPETTIDPVVALALACVLLVAIVLFVTWRRRRRPRHRARRQLARLQAEYQYKRLDNRSASYRLVAILQSGLQRTAISDTTELPPRLATRQQRWHAFVTQLRQARYTRTSCDGTQLEALFAQAQYWLRHWS